MPGLKDRLTDAGSGKPPITLRIGSVPLGTFRFASTSPDSLTTATWERLRCTSIPTWTDIADLLSELECHPEAKLTGLSRKGGPASRPAPIESVLRVLERCAIGV
jgi:hypothetical protein